MSYGLAAFVSGKYARGWVLCGVIVHSKLNLLRETLNLNILAFWGYLTDCSDL